MEKTYNPALIQRTQRYMETHSISQNQFAAKVNLSSAALSSYLNQKYKGSVEAVERQMLRITCRSSASAAWCRLLQTLCWRFARNAS